MALAQWGWWCIQQISTVFLSLENGHPNIKNKVRDNMEVPSNSLSPLEAHLAQALKPVVAPQDINRRLRGRIRLPGPRQIAKRLSDWYFVFFVVGGVISATMVLATLARAIYFFTRRRA